MTQQQWLSALSQTKLLKIPRLEIGGQGEPTLHPGFSSIVNKAYELGYKIEILTNAAQIKKLRVHLQKIDEITVNLNAMDEKEFAAIHAPSEQMTLDKVLSHITTLLCDIRREKIKTRIQIHHLITKNNALRCVQFPRFVHDAIQNRSGSPLPIRIKFKHLLVTPFNYQQLPSPDLLRLSLKFWRRCAKHPFYKRTTNLDSFIQKTEKMLPYFEALWPFEKDTQKKYFPMAIRKKLDRRFVCPFYKSYLFVDCNGDVFNCANPSRIIHGFLSYQEDPFYMGHALREPLEAIVCRSKKAPPPLDWSKAYWKSCLTCC